MKPFLKRVVAFLLLQALLFAMFWRPAMPFENSYIAATIDKHERLRGTPSPRLILVGGSNLAFGIKSKSLEEQTGRPIVNMGLHCGFGIDFMLREVENEIRTGDVVVLSFEHEIFSASGIELLATQLLEVRPASISLFPPSEWTTLIDDRGFAIVGGIARRTLLRSFEEPQPLMAGTYKRELFDPQGSYIGHFGLLPALGKTVPKHISPISNTIRTKMEHFAKLCRDRGALCFYSCPPHPDLLLAPIREKIEANLTELKKIPHLVVLDHPLDHSYPEDLFYDSAYHLGEEGAEQRTRKVAEALRPFLSETRFAARAASSR